MGELGTVQTQNRKELTMKWKYRRPTTEAGEISLSVRTETERRFRLYHAAPALLEAAMNARRWMEASDHPEAQRICDELEVAIDMAEGRKFPKHR